MNFNENKFTSYPIISPRNSSRARQEEKASKRNETQLPPPFFVESQTGVDDVIEEEYRIDIEAVSGGGGKNETS